MGLVKCPDCGREISERAVSCPNCGCPISEIIQKERSEQLHHRAAKKLKEGVVKRPPYVTVVLAIMAIVNAVGAVMYFYGLFYPPVFGYRQINGHQIPIHPSYLTTWMGFIIGIVSLIAARNLFRWKRSGFRLLVFCAAFHFIFLFFTQGWTFAASLIAFLWVGVTYAVLRQKTEGVTTWSLLK